MAGALARAVGYAEGGDVAPEDPQVGAGNAYAANPGAFAQSQDTDPEEALANLGNIIPKDVPGAFARNQQSYDAAKQRQLDLIRQARARIPSANGVVDPQLAAAGALLTTGGNFGQGLGAAFNAYGGAKQRQYQNELQNAQEQGRYDIDEGTADVQGAEGDFGFLKEQIGLGEKAAATKDIIEQRRQAAADRLAQTQALAAERTSRDAATQQAREDAIQQRKDAAAATVAERQRERDEAAQYSTWIGNDPKSGLPIFANKLGQTRFGDLPIQPKPSGAGAGAAPALVQQTEWAVRTGQIPDTPDARAAYGARFRNLDVNPKDYTNLVQKEEDRLSRTGKTDANGQYVGPYAESEVHDIAVGNVQRAMNESKSTALPRPRPSAIGTPSPAGGIPYALPPTRPATATPAAAPTPTATGGKSPVPAAAAPIPQRPAPAAAAPTYNSKEDVQAAYRAGKLSRDQALQIIRARGWGK